MEMAYRIKERRIAMGLTQEELAEKCGLQKSAIAKYENGRVVNMKRSVIAKMSEVLECNPAYLMGFDDTVQTIGQEKEYYESPEQAKMAQEMFEDRDMRMLFDMKKRMTPERFARQMQTFRDMYRLEHPEEFPEEWMD